MTHVYCEFFKCRFSRCCYRKNTHTSLEHMLRPYTHTQTHAHTHTHTRTHTHTHAHTHTHTHTHIHTESDLSHAVGLILSVHILAGPHLSSPTKITPLSPRCSGTLLSNVFSFGGSAVLLIGLFLMLVWGCRHRTPDLAHLSSVRQARRW